MKRVVLITGHYLNSKRKAGFHWLAEAYWNMGWEVIFATVSISWISKLRHDHRFQYPIQKEANRLLWSKERLGSFVYYTMWHPAHLRSNLLNRLTQPFFRQYGKRGLKGLEHWIERASLIIFESTPGLLLYDRCRELNPSARYVYRVSDDLRVLKNHPVALETEERISPEFDLISIPSAYIYKRFAHLPNAKLQFHAVQKEYFHQKMKSPYTDRCNAVFVGNAYFDDEAVQYAAFKRPTWNFHIIGPVKCTTRLHNVMVYGEQPFRETVKYIQFADIGLHTLKYDEGRESFTDSLKVLQYTYCKLPIIAPLFLKTDRPHTFYYDPNSPDSIVDAIDSAACYDRSQINTKCITSWKELALLLGGGHDEASVAL